MLQEMIAASPRLLAGAGGRWETTADDGAASAERRPGETPRPGRAPTEEPGSA